MTADNDPDEMANNILAAGALWATLLSGLGKGGLAEVEIPLFDGMPRNQLDVRFDFLNSPYRITVERIPE